MRASTAFSIQLADSRAISTEQDCARTIRADQSVTASILSNMKKLQRSKDNRLAKEAETVRDQAVSLESVLCTSINQNKKITDEATRDAKQAVTTSVREKERRLKHMHANAIEPKQSVIVKVRKNVKSTLVKCKLVEKTLKEDDQKKQKVADDVKPNVVLEEVVDEATKNMWKEQWEVFVAEKKKNKFTDVAIEVCDSIEGCRITYEVI